VRGTQTAGFAAKRRYKRVLRPNCVTNGFRAQTALQTGFAPKLRYKRAWRPKCVTKGGWGVRAAQTAGFAAKLRYEVGRPNCVKARCMPMGTLQLHAGGACSGATPSLASAVAVASAALKHCLGVSAAGAALSLPCGGLSHEHALLRSLISSPLSSSSVGPSSPCPKAASIYCASAFMGRRKRTVAPIASTMYRLHLPWCLRHASV